jgi:hypothetical protein
MAHRPFSHLSDAELVRSIREVLAIQHERTARHLATIGEFDARELYRSDGYASMLELCVRKLNMDEDEAEERIRAARVARMYPAIFELIAAGRLQPYAVVMLAPHLTPENTDELLAEAAGRTEQELKRLIAERLAGRSAAPRTPGHRGGPEE